VVNDEAAKRLCSNDYFNGGERSMENHQNLLEGAIDIHVHNMMMPAYRWNLIELAERAIAAKMGAIVLKNRYGASSETAYLANHIVGRDIFIGSIVLNGWLGGLNPLAVSGYLKYAGGIRIVSMPTTHALHNLRLSKGNTENAVLLFKNGKASSGLKKILDIIAENNLVLATGHISPEESLVLIDEAQKAGVTKIVVTHALNVPVMASLEQQKEMVNKGALIEHCAGACLPFHSIKMKKRYHIDVPYNTEKIIANLLAVGIANCLVSTDLGQGYNPYAVEGLKIFIRALLEFGLSFEEIKVLVNHNPRKLLGLDQETN
jgi:hypothetical protein